MTRSLRDDGCVCLIISSIHCCAIGAGEMIRVAPDGTAGWNGKEKYGKRKYKIDEYEVETIACKQASKACSQAGGRKGKPSLPLACECAQEASLQASETAKLSKTWVSISLLASNHPFQSFTGLG